MRTQLLCMAVLFGLSFAASAEGLQPIKKVSPVFPPEAARAGASGYVDVEYVVNPAGKVDSVSVTDAKPRRMFEASAVRAVKQWEFAPGGGRGKVRLDFKM